jgi:glycosyltransferase involved in cell wall biosynthesis
VSSGREGAGVGRPEPAPGAQHPQAGSQPSVCVVIATYNCADCILTAIASVQAQTWPGARILVVDDASTDETGALLAPLAARGELTYLRVSHRGCGAARNAGIRVVADDLIALLDADDTFEPDALRVMVEALQAAPEAGFCITDVARVYPDRTEVRSGRPPEGDLLLALLRENFIQGNNLFRRQALLDAGLFDESFHNLEDWELYIRLLARGIRPVYVEGAWYRYVMRGDSNTRDLTGIVESKRRLLAKHHKRMADEGVPGLRAIYADQLWWMARMYHGPLHQPGRALLCLLEGVRYDPDPRRILRTIRTRLRGPRE